MPQIRLGHGYISSGNRLLREVNKEKRYVLISWQDKKCIYCGKFISKKNSGNTCKKCYKKLFKIYLKAYDFLRRRGLLKYYK